MLGLLPYINRGEGYFNRTNTGTFQTKRSNGSSGFVSSGTPGQPDITGVYLGLAVYIEVKTDHGRLSEVQRQAHDKIRQAGGYVIVARSFETVQKAFAELKEHRKLLSDYSN